MILRELQGRIITRLRVPLNASQCTNLLIAKTSKRRLAAPRYWIGRSLTAIFFEIDASATQRLLEWCRILSEGHTIHKIANQRGPQFGRECLYCHCHLPEETGGIHIIYRDL